ncbi:hypothetical protein LTR09_000996 [Extremus antarcticus]|uniref:Uncharacterized protein n=1 Tax=Extremus antarcticus TaxID=702011 RepID=A0AAJ0LWB4_9PEZI|nr:hypothetical protein LTR09_000996 [Extremus antarcticus]
MSLSFQFPSGTFIIPNMQRSKRSKRARAVTESQVVNPVMPVNPGPFDLLRSLLVATIHEYRISSFENFGIVVWVKPAEDAREFYDTSNQSIGWTSYTFRTLHQPDKTMSVAMASATGQMRVWFGGSWSPMSRFLDLVQPAIASIDGEGGFSRGENKRFLWQQQSRWWLSNGKHFPLVKLPGELRNKIYVYALGDKIKPFPKHESRPSKTTHRSESNAALLRVSKLIYREASDVLFTFTPFHIEYYGIAAKLLRNIGRPNPPPRLRIRQLELALPHDSFFELFGGKVMLLKGSIALTRLSFAARALRTMDLSKLVLDINPATLLTSTHRFEGMCQKIVVDWILEMAWPSVRGHPVVVQGYVKTEQKKQFEAACKAAKKDFKMWQKQMIAIRLGEGCLRGYDMWVKEMKEEDGGVAMVYEVGAGGEHECGYGCADGCESEQGYVQEDGHAAGHEDASDHEHKDGHQAKVWEAGKVTIMPLMPDCECEVPCTAEFWSADR